MASLINTPITPLRPEDMASVGPADAYTSTTGALADWIARQRAESAAQGLWDDASGLPTRKGLMNAVQQYGGALVAGTSAPGQIRVFHGSPHDFEAFDASKIGTGEGAQAYGHGLYLAENEGVAKGYRDALSKWDNKVGQRVQEITGLDDLLPDALRSVQQVAMNKSLPPDQAARILAARVRELRGFDDPSMLAPKPTLEKLVTAIRADQNPGRLYEARINANPDHFLDWDKPLSEQPGVAERITGRTDWTTPDMTGARLLGEIQKRVKNDPVEASRQLNEMGIPGIRYLDQGSRASGEGTNNYVVFDPTTIEILRKYGIAGLTTVVAAAANQQ